MARKPAKTKFQLVMLNRQHGALKDLSSRAKASPGALAGDIIESFRDQFMKIKLEHGMQFAHTHDPAIIQMLLMKNAGMISGKQFDAFMQGIRPKTGREE
jgi:hypothetical protein